jgi:formiminoglutamase
MFSKLYKKTNPEIWSGRIDSEDDPTQFRYHQVVKCEDLNEIDDKEEFALLAFASDEGVRRNHGRVGASEGPDYFRKTIGSLCWHQPDSGFIDAGTISPEGENLEEAQQEFGKAVHRLLEKNKKPFVIGGGHETAFGHYQGIASYLKEYEPDARLGILNIDAHFDLRPHNGVPHSGSPFLQAHEHAEEHDIDLKYFVYGISPMNNTLSLFQKAEELGAEFCTNEEIFKHELDALQKLRYFLRERTHIYLTVCLDVFHAAMAPGVSAPAWNGIRMSHAQKVFEFVRRSGQLISMDVCELNPKYDEHQKTAKVAGTLFSELVG